MSSQSEVNASIQRGLNVLREWVAKPESAIDDNMLYDLTAVLSSSAIETVRAGKFTELTQVINSGLLAAYHIGKANRGQ